MTAPHPAPLPGAYPVSLAVGPAGQTRPDPQRILALGRDVLQTEAEAVAALGARLDDSFVAAVQLLLDCTGRVAVSGIGKSGHIAHKIAATFSSTGTPAFFVHAAEANHGDLGMVTGSDVLIALSNSGETAELLTILPVLKRQGTRLITMTGNPDSSLARIANVHLLAGAEREACPLNLAPTASTTAALALGDALAVTLLELRGFNHEDYARSHPGGALGRRLLTRVSDIMRTGDAIPKVPRTALLSEALLEMTRKRLAMTAVLDESGALVGVFTDGDLRRLFETVHDLSGLVIGEVMHARPRTIEADRLAVEAADQMEHFRINQLLVVDAQGQLVGAVHIHDLTNAKVI